MTGYTIVPIGIVQGGRSAPDDDDWGRSHAWIRLDSERFAPEALAGLDSFSHIEILFLFDRVDEASIETGARHPRGRADWPRVGIFAQRAKDRPNRIGVTACRILRVDGLTIEVAGLDAIDGTPVIDLKPVMSGFLPRGTVREPDWARAIMTDYW